MSKYLVNTTETFRVDTLEEVERLQEEVKSDHRYETASFTYKSKCSKSKGEIVDEWYQVTIKKKFNDEKEPITTVNIDYEVD